MNKIWFFLMTASALVLTIVSPETLLQNLLGTSGNVINLCIEFCAIYAIWMGLIEILEASGLSEKLSKAMSPPIKKLFKTENKAAITQISISLSANILGLGNAATPSAISALQILDDKSGKLTYPMLMLTIFSTCSIQLIPTTIISLRQQAGSQNAYDIILPVIIVSIVVASFAVACVIFWGKIQNHFQNLKRMHSLKNKYAKTK